MTVTWPVTISYPTGLDTFYAGSPLADGVDQVIDNHPNTIAKSIVALETKLTVPPAPPPPPPVKRLSTYSTRITCTTITSLASSSCFC